MSGASRPPLEVLPIATLEAARLAKADADLGSIEPGKKADLVLVAGNPTANITDVRRCTIVVKNGVVYWSDQLYEAPVIKLREQ